MHENTLYKGAGIIGVVIEKKNNVIQGTWIFGCNGRGQDRSNLDNENCHQE